MNPLTQPQRDALRESLLEELNGYRQHEVTAETKLSDLNLDSLDRIDMILEVEKTCDCTIDTAALDAPATTVGDLLLNVCKHAAFQ